MNRYCQNIKPYYMTGRWQIHVHYGSMLYIPTTTCHLLAADQEPCKRPNTPNSWGKTLQTIQGKSPRKGHIKSRTRQKK